MTPTTTTRVLLVAAAFIAIVSAVAKPSPMPSKLSTSPPPRPAAVVSRGIEIATFDEKDLTLDINVHAPRALLVCLRGDCRLVEAWLEK